VNTTNAPHLTETGRREHVQARITESLGWHFPDMADDQVERLAFSLRVAFDELALDGYLPTRGVS